MILNSTARSQEQIKEIEMREEAYSFVKHVIQRILVFIITYILQIFTLSNDTITISKLYLDKFSNTSNIINLKYSKNKKHIFK